MVLLMSGSLLLLCGWVSQMSGLSILIYRFSDRVVCITYGMKVLTIYGMSFGIHLLGKGILIVFQISFPMLNYGKIEIPRSQILLLGGGMKYLREALEIVIS